MESNDLTAIRDRGPFVACVSDVRFAVQQAFLYLSDLEMKQRICDQDEFVSCGVVPIAYAARAWGGTDKITDIPVAPEWAEHGIRGMEAAATRVRCG